MAIEVMSPSFIHHELTWGVPDDTIPDLTFSVRASTFKYALGLRPRAAADTKIAQRLARQNWELLKLIAREAEAEGGIIKTHNHNGWRINRTIDDAIFSRLLDRHRSQLVR